MLDLEQLRLKYGLKIQEAAELCEVPYRTYQNWESGIRNPPKYVLNYVKHVLDSSKKKVIVEISKDALIISVTENGKSRGFDVYPLGKAKKIPLSALEWVADLAADGYTISVVRK